MVDFFLVLLQPGAGDELQGIKKGVLELADSLVVNKADGAQLEAAERCAGEHARALGLLHVRSANWTPRVLMVSSLQRTGIDGVWEAILEHTAALESSGEWQTRRKEQARQWMWSLVEEGLRSSFRAHPDVSSQIDPLERAVQNLEISPAAAARALLEAFRS
jgi:LAO/AO transport system kinase